MRRGLAERFVDDDGRSWFGWSRVATALLVLAVGCAVFVVWTVVRPDHGLWYDELQSVTLAGPSPFEFDADNRLSLPVPRTVLGVLRYDPHPPLYYLQLHFWMLGGTSERWLRANSGLWTALAAVAMVTAGARLVGRRAAVLAACLFIVSPLVIGFSWQVRMYTLWMFEAVVAAWLNQLVLSPTTRHRWGAAVGLAVVVSAELATHGAAFLLVPALAVHGVLLIRDHRPDRRVIGLWICSLAIAGTTAVPWLARAALATPPLGHLQVATVSNVITVLTSLMLGEQLSSSWPMMVVATGVWLLVVLVGLRGSKSRDLVVAYLVVPIVVCFVLSRTVSPLWHVRALSFLVPMWCLAVGSTVVTIAERVERGPTRRLVVEAGLLMALMVVSVVATASLDLDRGRMPGFREAVAYSSRTFAGDDIVVIPNPRVFWGWGWYAAGPGRVDVLDATQELPGPNGERIVQGANHYAPTAGRRWLVRRSASERIEGMIERAVRSFGEVEIVETADGSGPGALDR